MKYIVLELFPEPWIVTNEEEKIPLFNLKEAYLQARECQQGMVVPLEPRLLEDIREAWYKSIDSYTHKILGKYIVDESD